MLHNPKKLIGNFGQSMIINRIHFLTFQYVFDSCLTFILVNQKKEKGKIPKKHKFLLKNY